jgi:hypothetical protein
MKLIELPVQDKIYFINPAQITYAIGNDREDRGSIYITVMLTEQTKSSESVKLMFTGDDARRLISDLRGLGLH